MEAVALMKEAQDAKLTGRGMFALIAARLGIDYCVDRETEKLIRTRHEGRWVQTGEHTRSWDNGRDYSKDNWPDSFNTIEEAFDKVGRIEAIWYHIPSMNLVLYDGKQKVGIRSMEWRIFFLGMLPNKIQDIINGLTSNKVRHGQEH